MTASPTPSLTVVDPTTLPASLVIDVPAGTSPEVWRYVARVGETLEELLAAVANTTTRAAENTTADAFAHPSVLGAIRRSSTRLDLDARSLWREGEQIHLTHLEFELLVYFVNNPSRAIHRDELLDRVWKQPIWPGSARTVDVHVRRLRRKLGSTLRLVTVRGFGYRLDGWPHPVS